MVRHDQTVEIVTPQASAAWKWSDGTNETGFYVRLGTPEANITAPVGSLAMDKTNRVLYLKDTGVGNTGWIPFPLADTSITSGNLPTATVNRTVNMGTKGLTFTNLDWFIVAGAASSSIQLEAGDILFKHPSVGVAGGFNLADADVSATVGIRSPLILSSTYTITLPTAPPASNGQVLSFTTAATASFVTPPTITTGTLVSASGARSVPMNGQNLTFSSMANLTMAGSTGSIFTFQAQDFIIDSPVANTPGRVTFQDGDNSHNVKLGASVTTTASYTLTLPPAGPDGDRLLQFNASGIGSFVTPPVDTSITTGVLQPATENRVADFDNWSFTANNCNGVFWNLVSEQAFGIDAERLILSNPDNIAASMRLYGTGGTNYVTLWGPTAPSGNTNIRLPNAAPAVGQVMVATSTGGQLDWQDVDSRKMSADDLGNIITAAPIDFDSGSYDNKKATVTGSIGGGIDLTATRSGHYGLILTAVAGPYSLTWSDTFVTGTPPASIDSETLLLEFYYDHLASQWHYIDPSAAAVVDTNITRGTLLPALGNRSVDMDGHVFTLFDALAIYLRASSTLKLESDYRVQISPTGLGSGFTPLVWSDPDGTVTLSLSPPAGFSSTYGITLPPAAPTANNQIMTFTTGGAASFVDPPNITTGTLAAATGSRDVDLGGWNLTFDNINDFYINGLSTIITGAYTALKGDGGVAGLRLYDADDSAYVMLKPATTTTTYSITLPAAKPTVNGQVMSFNTSGVGSFVTPVDSHFLNTDLTNTSGTAKNHTLNNQFLSFWGGTNANDGSVLNINGQTTFIRGGTSTAYGGITLNADGIDLNFEGISQDLKINGSAGTNGQFLKSLGPDFAPTWDEIVSRKMGADNLGNIAVAAPFDFDDNNYDNKIVTVTASVNTILLTATRTGYYSIRFKAAAGPYNLGWGSIPFYSATPPASINAETILVELYYDAVDNIWHYVNAVTSGSDTSITSGVLASATGSRSVPMSGWPLSIDQADGVTIEAYNGLTIHGENGVAAAKVQLYDADLTNYVNISAPFAVSANWTFTLPSAPPVSNGQFISVTTSGAASFVDPPNITTGTLANASVTRNVPMNSQDLNFNAMANLSMAGTTGSVFTFQCQDFIIDSPVSATPGRVTFQDGDNSHNVKLGAAAVTTASYALTLPPAAPAGDRFIQFDASGIGSFVAAPADTNFANTNLNVSTGRAHSFNQNSVGMYGNTSLITGCAIEFNDQSLVLVGGLIGSFTYVSMELDATGLDLVFDGTASLQIGGNAGTAGQVLTSNGPNAAPSWQAAGAGSDTSITTGVLGNAVDPRSVPMNNQNLTFTGMADLTMIGTTGSEFTFQCENFIIDSPVSATPGRVTFQDGDNSHNVKLGAAVVTTESYTLTLPPAGPGGNRIIQYDASGIGSFITVPANTNMVTTNLSASGVRSHQFNTNSFSMNGNTSGVDGCYVEWNNQTLFMLGGFVGGGNYGAIEIDSTGIDLQFTGTADFQINGSTGAAGQVITSNGPNAAPTWETPSAIVSRKEDADDLGTQGTNQTVDFDAGSYDNKRLVMSAGFQITLDFGTTRSGQYQLHLSSSSGAANRAVTWALANSTTLEGQLPSIVPGATNTAPMMLVFNYDASSNTATFVAPADTKELVVDGTALAGTWTPDLGYYYSNVRVTGVIPGGVTINPVTNPEPGGVVHIRFEAIQTNTPTVGTYTSKNANPDWTKANVTFVILESDGDQLLSVYNPI